MPLLSTVSSPLVKNGFSGNIAMLSSGRETVKACLKKPYGLTTWPRSDGSTMFWALPRSGNQFPMPHSTKCFTITLKKLATFTERKMEMRSESTRSVYFCTMSHPSGKTKLTNKVENSESTLTHLRTPCKHFGNELFSISWWKNSLKSTWLPESEFWTKALIELEQQALSDLRFGQSSQPVTKTLELKSKNIWRKESFLRLWTLPKRMMTLHLWSANAIPIRWLNSNSTKFDRM